MNVDEGHVNQAEFPEAAAQQAREEYSADSDSFGEKDPFKLRKEKKEIEKKKKEKGYKTFEAESFSEEDDERGKGKKRSYIFRNRFAPSTKAKPKDKQKGDERDGKTEERRPSKDKGKEEKRMKGGGEERKMKGVIEEKKRSKSKEREKLKKKSHTVDIPVVKPEPVFGVPFADAVARTKLYDNIELPRIVRECVDYVEECGLTTPGIYRLSGVKSKVEVLKSQYNGGEKVNLRDYDATIITSLLKQYLRELPETVLTTRLTPAFEHSAGLPNATEKLAAFKEVLSQLPKCNYTLISWMVVHLAHILEKKDETKMTIQNLSIVMCPTMRISHRTMNLLFTYWKELFGNVQLKKCPKPLIWTPGSVFEMPETTAELEEELLRHETILAKMHEDLNRGTADKSTEDHLWEVQRVVTQLKRKLRVSRRVSETRLAAKEKEMEDKDSKAVSKERSPAKTMSLPPSTLEKTVTEKPADEAKEKANEKETPEIEASESMAEAESLKKDIKEEAPDAQRTKDATGRSDGEEETEKAAEADLEMMKLLLLSQAGVVAEQEELMNIRNDLQKRIEAERQEIARLQSAISEAKQADRRRGTSVDSIDSSVASESSSESEDEEELQKILDGLIRENEELKRKNMHLSYNIHNEREACAELRVQIKLQEQMPQMLEALAQAGLKSPTKSQPKSALVGELSPRRKAEEPLRESRAEEIKQKNGHKTVKSENSNSNASPGIGGDGDNDDAVAIVTKEKGRVVEETAL